jgi:hypothetical protein
MYFSTFAPASLNSNFFDQCADNQFDFLDRCGSQVSGNYSQKEPNLTEKPPDRMPGPIRKLGDVPPQSVWQVLTLFGMLPPSSQGSRMNRAPSGPQTSGSVFGTMNGMMKLSGRVSIEFPLPSATHVTSPHRDHFMVSPLVRVTGLFSGMILSWAATR